MAFPSIMSLFSGGGSTSAAAPQDPATTTPATTATTPAAEPAAPVDPLDAFKDLWTPLKEGEGPETFDPSKMFNIEPEKFQQSVAGINFANSVKPEQLARIQAGGEDALKANLEVMNSIAQQAFMQSMLGASKLVEGAMTQANSHLDSRIESRTKQLSVSSSLREANPALSHPAAAPLVTAMEQQFSVKYPQASPAEITKLATDYLANFAHVAAGKPAADPKATNTGTDWEAFLGGQ